MKKPCVLVRWAGLLALAWGVCGADRAEAAQCTRWVKHTGPGPGARYGHAMAYDASRGVIVLFGGISGDDDEYHADTWEFTKEGWRQVTSPDGTLPGPAARGAHAMAYDPRRREVLLVGGIDGDHDPLRDVWAYGEHPLGGHWWRRVADLPRPPFSGHSTPGGVGAFRACDGV